MYDELFLWSIRIIGYNTVKQMNRWTIWTGDLFIAVKVYAEKPHFFGELLKEK